MNPRISFYKFRIKFREFLSQICDCTALNPQIHKICVSKRLFEEEIDFVNKRDKALEKATRIFHQYADPRDRETLMNEFKPFLDIISVTDDDVDEIECKGDSIFRHPPGKCDVSLMVLGLQETHNKSFRGYIITEDTTLSAKVFRQSIIGSIKITTHFKKGQCFN